MTPKAPDGSQTFSLAVDRAFAGMRLDFLVSHRLDGCSRAAAASSIRSGLVVVDGNAKRPGYRVKWGERINGRIAAPPPVSFSPENLPIDILYEDDHIIVVNKPPGLVVHPACGHFSGTLVNALLYHFPDIEGVGAGGRPGIVHRLDQDTSGVMVVAKEVRSHNDLAAQFKTRQVSKSYLALVWGRVDPQRGAICLPIGRHPVHRKQMSTRSPRGRRAETRWRVAEYLNGVTLLRLGLMTGRTHQIRVHCAAIQHPIVGDAVYGAKKANKMISSEDGRKGRRLPPVTRQMLHAWRLKFRHPVAGHDLAFEAPIPEDMRRVIDDLRNRRPKEAGQRDDRQPTVAR